MGICDVIGTRTKWLVGASCALCLALAMVWLACGDASVAVAPLQADRPCGERFAWIKTELYFGLGKLGKPGGRVSEQEWEDYISEFVTPRLKEGLTVITAYGQWLPPEGALVREESKILVFIHRDDGLYEKGIEEIRSEYKKRFLHRSVLRVDIPVSASY